jgi:hydroxylaminobenzene mutase
MDWVIQAGLIELAIGGLLGWAMVLRQESPELLRRIGIVAPQRIRQIHLDYVMMGLILIGVGLAVPDLPTAIAVALVFGTAVNPFLFLPLAFDPEIEKRLWYRSLAVVSFLGVSGGLLAAAIVGPGDRRGPSG